MSPSSIIGLTLACAAAASALAFHQSGPHLEREAFAVGDCRAVDGDTIDCQGLRIRLNGIDSPEMPGHCRPGRHCAPGDPWDSRVSLASLLTLGDVRIVPFKKDRYGRVVAEVTVGYLSAFDLSCEQLKRGQAIYKPKWDEARTTQAKCPGWAGKRLML